MLTTNTTTRRRWQRSLAALAVLSLTAAACGSDDDASDDSAPAETTAEEEVTEAEPEEAAEEEAAEEEAMEEEVADEEAMEEEVSEAGGDIAQFDANGDGEVRIGIAAAGPRDDGGYYQAVVDAAEEFSVENGFGEVIIVDNIQSADTATE